LRGEAETNGRYQVAAYKEGKAGIMVQTGKVGIRGMFDQPTEEMLRHPTTAAVIP
jgi:hypothetical protein